MKWSWIDLNFPWVGLIAAVAVLGFLFSTNKLRSRLSGSRWRDPTWLSWLAVAVYLIHNVEEYGLDLVGQAHAFPQSMCATLGQPPYPACSIPPAFFLAVNLPLFWVGAPIAALLSRRHPLLGLSYYGIIFVNGLAHVIALLRVGYNPGAFTALILFLPLSVWVVRACFGRTGLRLRSLALIVADGVLLHIVLIGSSVLFLRGLLTPFVLTLVQILNAILFFAIVWLGEKWVDVPRRVL